MSQIAAKNPMSPAQQVIDRYGADYTAIGGEASVVDGQATVIFHNNFIGTNATAALRDSVDGVRVLVRNESLTLDYHTPSARGVAELLKQHPAVVDAFAGGKGPRGKTDVVIATTREAADAERLNAIFRSQLADGSPILIGGPGAQRGLPGDGKTTH